MKKRYCVSLSRNYAVEFPFDDSFGSSMSSSSIRDSLQFSWPILYWRVRVFFSHKRLLLCDNMVAVSRPMRRDIRTIVVFAWYLSPNDNTLAPCLPSHKTGYDITINIEFRFYLFIILCVCNLFTKFTSNIYQKKSVETN